MLHDQPVCAGPCAPSVRDNQSYEDEIQQERIVRSQLPVGRLCRHYEVGLRALQFWGNDSLWQAKAGQYWDSTSALHTHPQVHYMWQQQSARVNPLQIFLKV